jgi:hypothetical protein
LNLGTTEPDTRPSGLGRHGRGRSRRLRLDRRRVWTFHRNSPEVGRLRATFGEEGGRQPSSSHASYQAGEAAVNGKFGGCPSLRD